MKKTLVALAALAATGAFAQATVYGRVDIGYGQTTTNGVTTSTAQQSAYDSPTVFGLKVSESLGNGLKAGAQFETGSFSSVNGGAAGLNMTRASWASIGTDTVSLKLGRQTSTSTIGNAAFDLGGVLGSSAYVAAGISPTVNYGSSKRSGQAAVDFNVGNGISGQFAYTLAADYINNYAVAAANANSVSALAVNYASGPLAVGFQMETARTNLAGNRQAASLAGSYNFGPAVASLNLVQSEFDTAANATANRAAAGSSAGTLNFGAGWGIGLAAPVGAATLGIQYAKNNENRADGSSVFAFELFAKYNLSKMTNVYFEYGSASASATGANNTLGAGLMVNF